MTPAPDLTLRDIRIPRALLSDATFGGTVDGDYLRGDLDIRGGTVVGMQAAPPTDSPRCVIPKLTEAHCHLDKCHSIDRMGDVGGDLAAAIAAQARDKTLWDAADLSHRAAQGLRDCAEAGCGTVRSHIDWGDTAEPPLAWQVLPQLDPLGQTLQWAALTGIDQMADADFAASVAATVAATPGGVLGSFVLDHAPEATRDGLAQCFTLAERHGLALDFHVDETLGARDGVEAIADAALATGFQGPVLCGHAVALMDKPQDDFARIADKLARAGITVCALPTTNLYLQGRRDGTPDRRGITRLSELAARGVSVIVGSDNVADAFCPLGQHDPMAALHLACLAAHLDPPMARLLPMVTQTAQIALGLDAQPVDKSPIDRLLISHAASAERLVAGRDKLIPLTQYIETNHPGWKRKAS